MPSFVMGGRTYDASAYFRSKPFDVRTTPSEMGLVAEVFRRTPKVLRSVHPTCAVCALGPLGKELTTGHHMAETSLGPDSPFGVMTRRNTAILGLGVEYYRCLTHVHTAAQQMGDAFPIKFSTPSMQVTLVDYDGSRYEYTLGLPDRTKKLDLTILWSVLSKDELKEWRFHGVPMFVVPQAGVLTERLIEAARRGITVYGNVAVNADFAGATRQTLAQLQEVGITPVPKVKARQFVVPGTIGKLLYGALVNLFLLLPQPVLFQKLRQPLVQSGIIGIAIDFLAQHRQRLGHLLH